jgi:hypothetical protein
VGPITQQLKDLYFDAMTGRNPKYSDWCMPVYSAGSPIPAEERQVPVGLRAGDPAS